MAKAEWLNVNPASGSGDANVNVSSKSEHTGRKLRTTFLTWKASNVDDVVRTVNQAGKPEYVDIDDAASSEQAGKVVTIAGVSNSAKLTFSLGTGVLDISLPATYVANSMTTNNGAAISGDPGALAEYLFSISINVPANDSIEPQSRQIIVTDEAGHQDVCLLTLAAGEPYISIEEGTIELDYLGTAVTVAVESNTTWTVE
jgi:hypothetical protein